MSLSGAEPHGIVRRQTCLVLGRRQCRPRFTLAQLTRVERHRGDPSGPGGQRCPLVQLDQLTQRRDPMRAAAGALDLGLARLVAEHEQVRHAAVVEAERHAGVDRVQERALALDPEQLSPARGALDHELLGRAGDEVRHDRVDGDPPARDGDAGLARRDEHGLDAAPPRLEVELERDGHLPDRAVGADREHDRRRHLEIRAGRGGEILRRATQVPDLGAVARRQLAQLRNVGQEHVQPVLDVRGRAPGRSAGSPSRPAGSGPPASRRRRARCSARAGARRRRRRRPERRPRPRPHASSPGWRRRRRGGSAGRRASSSRSAGRRRSPPRG